MESPTFGMTSLTSPDQVFKKHSSFLLDDDTSRDSGYESPDMVLNAFSLDTPETKPVTPIKRVFNVNQVKRSLFFKRSRDELDSDDDVPSEKRLRSDSYHEDDVMQPETDMTSDVVKKAVDKMECDGSLVGDGSKTHSLPTVLGRHKDLRSVTSHTVKQLLAGKYNNVISGFTIIDCRYPYEYEGGHIKEAINLHTEAQISNFINNHQEDDSTYRNILIFHCEFSSERGPKLLRHLRSLDRTLNSDNYPFLFYPEVYLLHGGYKAFFEQHKDQCQPQTYLPMLHQDYSSELRHFRSTKAQAGRQKKRAVCRRQLVETSPCSFAL